MTQNMERGIARGGLLAQILPGARLGVWPGIWPGVWPGISSQKVRYCPGLCAMTAPPSAGLRMKDVMTLLSGTIVSMQKSRQPFQPPAESFCAS